jgi:Icc-related predicted phosphoesterase
MLILAISDIHGAFDRLAAMSGPCREADLVLVAGDLTDFGGAAEAARAIEALKWAGGRIAAVPGNCDKQGARAAMEESGISADGRLLELGGALVAGSGGSPLRTGMTPYERRDRDIADALLACLEGAIEPDGKPLIVLTHAPPKDSGADERKGSRTGSLALKEALASIAPALWVCGHIHESPCARLSGRSLVVNPGPLHDGRYALIELERESGGAWRAAAELRRDA